MKNIWILARMTFREAVRRRIVLTGLLLGICFLVVYSFGFHFIYISALSEEAAMASDPAKKALVHIGDTEGVNTLLMAGLYAVTFLSVAMAALLAADTLAGEINSGTIQTIVTK
ncbi:MAG TPA: hypothetical protein VHM28_05635, partial [Anaerolineales bacterium]|nr:hypothetical protein [Anaerolineales bacterium]